MCKSHSFSTSCMHTIYFAENRRKNRKHYIYPSIKKCFSSTTSSTVGNGLAPSETAKRTVFLTKVGTLRSGNSLAVEVCRKTLSSTQPPCLLSFHHGHDSDGRTVICSHRLRHGRHWDLARTSRVSHHEHQVGEEGGGLGQGLAEQEKIKIPSLP